MAWADEVAKRRNAAREEPFAFETAERNGIKVRSGSGNEYLVLPDLLGNPASCSCPDFRTAKLGTCKHVEATKLFRSGAKRSVEPPPRRASHAIPGIAFEPRGGEVLVLDLETQKAFDELPERRADGLGLSVGVVWSYQERSFSTYWEADAAALIDRLLAADLVVGFNHKRFDLEVLRPYAPNEPMEAVRCFDLLEDLHQRLGHRVGLDACCAATLQARKSGHGLQAITWYRQGRLDLLEHYCQEDVRLTRDLFDYGRVHGSIRFERRDSRGFPEVRSVDVSWQAQGLPAPVLRAVG